MQTDVCSALLADVRGWCVCALCATLMLGLLTCPGCSTMLLCLGVCTAPPITVLELFCPAVHRRMSADRWIYNWHLCSKTANVDAQQHFEGSLCVTQRCIIIKCNKFGSSACFLEVNGRLMHVWFTAERCILQLLNIPTRWQQRTHGVVCCH